ncbi:hypothetical protein DID88_001752 [Monilinia fructigena]|uniref:Exportin-5 C-terminal domain-containing protein n=1 Tax=Monilinia fructigena TaxID=38457 RepID=A0A395IX55_9HELO|nr:hypothetical protein DID88_001752 [Monilinia fructigena]
MNGSTNGHIAQLPTRYQLHKQNGNRALLSQIHEALELVHNNIKAEDEAPYHGFTLASDKSQQPVVRHYALSLLEHAIKHKWTAYSEAQASALRLWIIQLSENLAQEDPLYLRNKTAQLWVEVAKRSWGSEWTDMDKLLVRLWELPGPVVHKEFVLFVLETLSDEVFNGEDAVTVLREGALSKACVEIFTPAVVLSEAFPNRQLGTVLRHGGEGWLVRIGALLGHAQCVQYMCKCLAASSTPVQLASVQALYALYTRVHFSDEEFLELNCVVSRLIRYENMPDNCEDPEYLFLKEDIDTQPERHAFLGNYRRYLLADNRACCSTKAIRGLYHILGQVDNSLQHLYDGFENYSKTSIPILRVDKNFTVVEASLKGYMKWRGSHGSEPQRDEQERTSIENNLETWGERLLELKLHAKSSGTHLDDTTHGVSKYPAYTEAVKELQAESAYELQRLAGKMPNQLLDVYDQLQAKVNEIISTRNLDKKRQTSYQNLLVHDHMSWQDSEMNSAIQGFSGFCNLLGLNRVKDFLVTRRVHEIQDWSAYQLDSEAQSIQKDMEERLKALPLRTTKSFLGCSTEKMRKDDPAYQVSCDLWRDALPFILPNLLKYLSHAHAFHNPANWNELPPEMAPIVSRILTDRFWQAGISVGSKDDFYARVSGTKSTMEGLASSIRGSIRTVRESCYSILFSMSSLDVDFYGFSELPGPLAHALFADAHCLSSHQLIALLNIVRLLVDECPVEVRSHFVPPILASCFTQMDAKCSSEWEELSHKNVVPADEDTLTEEMKEESILRQLTHTSVMMVAGFLDPARINIGSAPSSRSAKEASTFIQTQANAYPSMRKFCLTSSTILEPLLLFLTHAIRMRDTRCCGVVLRVFRSIVPDFASSDDSPLSSSIREFISIEVLKAAISSLNEPYFVELQKDLAHLISSILIYYAPLTGTPKQILLSLPGIQEKAIDKCIESLQKQGIQQRQQRALVLYLLKDLKGISISEQGRISKSASVVRKERSKMQEAFYEGAG